MHLLSYEPVRIKFIKSHAAAKNCVLTRLLKRVDINIKKQNSIKHFAHTIRKPSLKLDSLELMHLTTSEYHQMQKKRKAYLAFVSCERKEKGRCSEQQQQHTLQQ